MMEEKPRKTMDEPIQPIRHARSENGRTRNPVTAAKRRSPFLESFSSLIVVSGQRHSFATITGMNDFPSFDSSS
jgi:hypothetical protein